MRTTLRYLLNTRQEIAQIEIGIQSGFLCRFHDAVERRTGLSTTRGVEINRWEVFYAYGRAKYTTNKGGEWQAL